MLLPLAATVISKVALFGLGRGVATHALAQFVDQVSTRPLYAHVAAHNVGSIRVLEKCGFRRDHGQEAKAPAPDDGIEEFTFVLNA